MQYRDLDDNFKETLQVDLVKLSLTSNDDNMICSSV